jgi:hypothetical protein
VPQNKIGGLHSFTFARPSLVARFVAEGSGASAILSRGTHIFRGPDAIKIKQPVFVDYLDEVMRCEGAIATACLLV